MNGSKYFAVYILASAQAGCLSRTTETVL